MIAKIFQNFDYCLEPNQSLAVAQDLTIHPKDGTKVLISLRNNNWIIWIINLNYCSILFIKIEKKLSFY